MKLNYKRTIFVGFAFFLITAFWTAYDAIIPMILVNKFGLNQSVSGVIMALDNILAVFLLPLFGMLSDKTNTKFGKRTPYIVIGTLCAVVAFIGLSYADNLQLTKLGEINDSTAFHQTLWEQNDEIVVNENNSFVTQKKTLSVRDYASKIALNKSYDEATDDEKQVVYEWFVNINKEYFDSQSSGEEAFETSYCFDGETYHLLTAKANDSGKTVWTYQTDGGEVTVKSADVINAYSSLITPARSAYAWRITKSNPMPLVLFIALLLLTLLSMSVFRSPAVALMPDVTIKPLRSQGNAVINLMGTVGGMLVLVLGIVFGTGKAFNQTMPYFKYILSVCLIMVFGLVMFIWKVREPKWASEMKETSDELGLDTSDSEFETTLPSDRKKLSKSKTLSLVLLLLSVALWYCGYNAVTSKYSLYAVNVLHMNYNTALLIAQAAAVVTFIPIGLASSKFGRRHVILFSVAVLTACFAVACFMTASTPEWIMFVLFAVAGVAWAGINVNSFPMVVELASGGNEGKYTGLYYTASMAAQIVTPILSGLIMDYVGSMKPLFPYAAIFVGLSFVTMLFVKYGDGKKISDVQKVG